MTKKNVFKMMTITAMICFAASAAQAKTWMAKYYEKNPMTADELAAEYGKPAGTFEKADGSKIQYYGPKDTVIGYTCFTVKDGMVVDKNVADTIRKNKVDKEYEGPVAKGHMAEFYASHPVSVNELKDGWGAPAAVCDYKNGVTKMTYGPKDIVVGYTYFLVKDGKVIDKNHTSKLEKNRIAKTCEEPKTSSLMAKHYAENPISMEELKAKLGQPISNHDYPNGVKKLTYGPKDPEIGYTYYIVKDGKVIDQNVTGAE